MKAAFLKSFVLGFTVGVGITVVSLYVQKPGCLVDSIEKISELGRARRAREEDERVEKKWLRDVGFSDHEIDEAF